METLKYHEFMPSIAYLECTRCRTQITAETPQTLCPQCGGVLFVRYDLAALRQSASRDDIQARAAAAPTSLGMWRYAAVLPAAEPVTLGEGFTPMLRSRRYPNLFLKEEAANPTGTFKARGLSMAVTMARHYRLQKLAVPSAGNAAGALAAYAAAASIEAHIFMPRDVPLANYLEAVAYGAKVTLVNGLISDCARIIAERKDAEGWFDISTLKEPYRIEGKKTMGYEVAEQFGWILPDAIFYPTGGGVGLIGMWKAFDVLEALGWISSARPKMIAVQAAGCQPVVRAFERGELKSTFWENAQTVAAGLRVPKPLGDALSLAALRASGGTAIAVSDEELLDASIQLAGATGIFPAPEGGACVAALKELLANGFLKPDERIVLYNTGTGLKYLEAFSTRFPRTTRSEQDKLGGLITPR